VSSLAGFAIRLESPLELPIEPLQDLEARLVVGLLGALEISLRALGQLRDPFGTHRHQLLVGPSVVSVDGGGATVLLRAVVFFAVVFLVVLFLAVVFLAVVFLAVVFFGAELTEDSSRATRRSSRSRSRWVARPRFWICPWISDRTIFRNS
jgi:hypothetical protein